MAGLREGDAALRGNLGGHGVRDVAEPVHRAAASRVLAPPPAGAGALLPVRPRGGPGGRGHRRGGAHRPPERLVAPRGQGGRGAARARRVTCLPRRSWHSAASERLARARHHRVLVRRGSARVGVRWRPQVTRRGHRSAPRGQQHRDDAPRGGRGPWHHARPLLSGGLRRPGRSAVCSCPSWSRLRFRSTWSTPPAPRPPPRARAVATSPWSSCAPTSASTPRSGLAPDPLRPTARVQRCGSSRP